MIANKELNSRQVYIIESLFILLFTFLPALIELPYRVNIFVTWEGAYRMSNGEIPFRDFGLPLGYGFWILPSIFFKIFGPYVFTLIITQCFINLISLITLRGILNLFGLPPIGILVSIVIFCLSFVMVNFWPWYNHTVFVYELIGLYFLVYYLLRSQKTVFIALGSFFIALCFFTKQDAGGLGLLLSLALLLTHTILEKKYKAILYFLGFYGVFLAIFILPMLSYDFSYWFNYGQAPHFSRINMYDFLTAFFEESLWIKFYIASIIVICIMRFKTIQQVKEDKRFLLFTIFTLGILAQAMIIQVTSFSPVTTNYYFHTFAAAFVLYHLSTIIPFERIWIAALIILLVFFWRSENYWKYSNRVLGKFLPASFTSPASSVVSKNTWAAKSDSVKTNPVRWSLSKYKTFKNIKLPVETISGIERIQSLSIVKANQELSCLNMTNLTPLAYELNYISTRAENFPLWYHKGVASFDRETKMLCAKVEQGDYDLILFEVMPDVDNFFPYEVRECVRKKYTLVDSFISPTGYKSDYIEVYIRE